MKKAILIFAILFTSSFYSNGQTRFGVKAGLNFASESVQSTGLSGVIPVQLLPSMQGFCWIFTYQIALFCNQIYYFLQKAIS